MKTYLYRIMSAEEFSYLQNRSMNFWKKRFKFFTPFMDFIMLIVDSNFNNKDIKTERYTHIVQFCFEGLTRDKIRKVGKYEYVIDRRNVNGIKFSYKLMNVMEG